MAAALPEDLIPMPELALSCAVFLAIHLLIAGTTMRDRVVAVLTEGGYMAAFSLASIAVIVWMCLSFNAALAGDNPQLWYLGEGVKHAGGIVMALAFLMVVPGLLTPNPTSVGQASLAGREDVARGMLRITRHPFLWGVAIWSSFHLLANGDEASAIFFGSFLVLSLAGTASIDAKRKRKSPEEWGRFAALTSNVPFAAILSGRNRLSIGELLTWRQLVAIIVFAGIFLTHHLIFGVSPFPGGRVPF